MRYTDTQTLVGCDKLRNWFRDSCFEVSYFDGSPSLNKCNWYAYRDSAIPARECELNLGKPMQVVVRPLLVDVPEFNLQLVSASVSVTGVFGDVPFKLECYSITHPVLMRRLPEIEARLIAAWNALRPAGEQE